MKMQQINLDQKSKLSRTLLISAWGLFSPKEKRKSFFLGVCILAGTFLEAVSIGALVPLMQVLTQSNLRTKYEILDDWFAYKSDGFIVSVILVTIVLIFVIKELFLGYTLWMQRGFVAELETRFQTELYNRYTLQPYEFHLVNNSSLLNRNILNSNNFTYNVLDPIFVLISDGLVTFVLCIALVIIEPVAMIATIFSASSIAILFHGFSKHKIESWGHERQSLDETKIRHLNETFGGMKDVIISGSGDFLRRQFMANINDLSNINRKFTTLLGIPRLYLEALAVTGLAVLVISMLALGRSTDSLLPLLALFAGGAFRLLPAVNRLTIAFQSLRMGKSIVGSLQTDLTEYSSQVLHSVSNDSLKFDSAICFEDVSYIYPGAENPSIISMNFKIEKGSIVGIIGTTGAGKSTLIDVLLGLLRPTSGTVTVDGVDIQSQMQSWHSQIGYVPQSIFLTDSSIRSNVAFGVNLPDIDNEQVFRALELAQLSEFVKSLPEEAETLVGERGVRISGGQRQRIGIARALYRNPTVLIFDEATSALDVNTENDVMSSLENIRADKTIVIVTHRISALVHCDRKIVISNGEIANIND